VDGIQAISVGMLRGLHDTAVKGTRPVINAALLRSRHGDP
jgi:hypothetical protein